MKDNLGWYIGHLMRTYLIPSRAMDYLQCNTPLLTPLFLTIICLFGTSKPNSLSLPEVLVV